MKKILFILFFVVLFQSVLPGASAGITPASHRQNKTVECIGNELNAILFYLSANNFLPNSFAPLSGTEALTLEINWPSDIEMTGWVNAHQGGAFFKPVFAGDELSSEVVVTKLTERNEKNGIVEITFYVKNQNGDLVLTNVTEMIVKRKR